MDYDYQMKSKYILMMHLYNICNVRIIQLHNNITDLLFMQQMTGEQSTRYSMCVCTMYFSFAGNVFQVQQNCIILLKIKIYFIMIRTENTTQ